MANILTPIDVYQLMNEIVSQATGRTDLAAVNTTNFASVGETVLRTGTENTLNAISTVISRTIFSVRPYRGKLDSLRVIGERWGAQVRKIVNLYQQAEASNDWNTDLNPNQIVNGNSIDMYKINKPLAVQLNFYGTKVLQKHITRFRDQLSLAFHDENEFMRFFDSVMVEFFNEVELLNEAESRATLLNFMAGISSMGLMEVDLVQEYNTTFSTTFTRAQLLTSELESFMKFLASQIKIWSSRLTDMSTLYHANLTGYEKIMRHTPRQRQKMIMYEPLFIQTQAQVYSSLFNPRYLDIGSFEGVNYWQSQSTPTSINVTPNILDIATGSSKNAESPVDLDYVIGLLFDEEAIGIYPQFDYASTTPFNSAGGYYNMYMHWRFNSYVDYTENAILFVMGAGGAGDSTVLSELEKLNGTADEILSDTMSISGNTASIENRVSTDIVPDVDSINTHAGSIDVKMRDNVIPNLNTLPDIKTQVTAIGNLTPDITTAVTSIDVKIPDNAIANIDLNASDTASSLYSMGVNGVNLNSTTSSDIHQTRLAAQSIDSKIPTDAISSIELQASDTANFLHNFDTSGVKLTTTTYNEIHNTRLAAQSIDSKMPATSSVSEESVPAEEESVSEESVPAEEESVPESKEPVKKSRRK